jgi:hypothetical protein
MAKKNLYFKPQARQKHEKGLQLGLSGLPTVNARFMPDCKKFTTI